ncbi:hypothetical protein EV426DRAFT_93670 [Tirmania nivea]|nr:hypothetical protein EV426DRAFT_93670 [Tirmania nivea]
MSYDSLQYWYQASRCVLAGGCLHTCMAKIYDTDARLNMIYYNDFHSQAHHHITFRWVNVMYNATCTASIVSNCKYRASIIGSVFFFFPNMYIHVNEFLPHAGSFVQRMGSPHLNFAFIHFSPASSLCIICPSSFLLQTLDLKVLRLLVGCLER